MKTKNIENNVYVRYNTPSNKYSKIFSITFVALTHFFKDNVIIVSGAVLFAYAFSKSFKFVLMLISFVFFLNPLGIVNSVAI